MRVILSHFIKRGNKDYETVLRLQRVNKNGSLKTAHCADFVDIIVSTETLLAQKSRINTRFHGGGARYRLRRAKATLSNLQTLGVTKCFSIAQSEISK
jgi:hypothetical protein